jgi:hypothetical protein
MNLLLALAGVCGLLVLVTADLVLVWTPARDLDVFRASENKTDARAIGGALAGVFAIPCVLAGVASLWPPLSATPMSIGALPLLLTAFAYVVGAGFHAGIGFFIIAIRDTPAEQRRSSTTIKSMQRIFRPLQSALWMSIFAASILLFVVILSGTSAYPRWVAAVSPLPLVLAFRIAGRVGPPWLAGAAVPAGGNVAMLVFLLVSLFATQ